MFRHLPVGRCNSSIGDMEVLAAIAQVVAQGAKSAELDDDEQLHCEATRSDVNTVTARRARATRLDLV